MHATEYGIATPTSKLLSLSAKKRERGPKTSGLSPSKAKSQKSVLSGSSKTTGVSSSPLKMSKGKSELSTTGKKIKPKGETSFIVEEMMDQGIAKGDITMSDGTGTDNMTCIIIQFRDPEEVENDKKQQAEEQKTS